MGATIDIAKLIQGQIATMTAVNENTDANTDNTDNTDNTNKDVDNLIANALASVNKVTEGTEDLEKSIGMAKSKEQMTSMLKNRKQLQGDTDDDYNKALSAAGKGGDTSRQDLRHNANTPFNYKHNNGELSLKDKIGSAVDKAKNAASGAKDSTLSHLGTHWPKYAAAAGAIGAGTAAYKYFKSRKK